MEIKKIDKLNMRQIILSFPKQFKIGLSAAKKVKVRGRFDKILICGMGGSALPGDILKIWMESYKIILPVHIHRNYALPYQTKKNHLVIFISYSGNTEETLSAFEEARRKRLPIAAICSGGKLAELCEKYKIPFAKVPSGLAPRLALGYQFAALMKILVNCGLIKDNLRNILALEKKLKPGKLEVKGLKLAKNLVGKIPLIYASCQRKALARIWKIKFNENSKVPAFYNYFPELDHNELSSFESGENFRVILLRDPKENPKILKRMDLTAEIIRKNGTAVDVVNAEGEEILLKTFSTLLLGDWVSYYLAKEYKVDPVTVSLQEEIKRKMARS